VHGNLEQHITSTLYTKEFTSNEDQILFGHKTRYFCAEHARERRREVNVGPSLFLDGLDDAALAPSNDIVKLVIDFTDFIVQSALLESQKSIYQGSED